MPSNTSTKTLTPKIIGHRGACGHAPENTLISIRNAHALGARWVEFDVMLSGDDVPILYHEGQTRRHSPYEPHAMRIGEKGFLTFALWRGKDMAQPPRLMV